VGQASGDDDEIPVDVPGVPRSSFWVRTFQMARDRGDWLRVPRFYTMTTASQLASDIVNANRRSPSSVRMRGILPGEIWAARWGHAPDGPSNDFAVWIRLITPGESDTSPADHPG
jgi:hypothetical protein